MKRLNWSRSNSHSIIILHTWTYVKIPSLFHQIDLSISRKIRRIGRLDRLNEIGWNMRTLSCKYIKIIYMTHSISNWTISKNKFWGSGSGSCFTALTTAYFFQRNSLINTKRGWQAAQPLTWLKQISIILVVHS